MWNRSVKFKIFQLVYECSTFPPTVRELIFATISRYSRGARVQKCQK